MLTSHEGAEHLIDEVVDVEHLQFHCGVVHRDGQVVGDVAAEGCYRGVVVRAAPLSVEVWEAIDEHPRSGLLAVAEHQFLAGLLAHAVLRFAEAAGEGGLDGTGNHHRAGVAVLLESVQKHGRESEIPIHELPGVLRAVDAGEVEHEVALAAPPVQLLRGGVDVVLEDLLYRQVPAAPRLAVPYVLKLCAEVPSHETLRARHENLHLQ